MKARTVRAVATRKPGKTELQHTVAAPAVPSAPSNRPVYLAAFGIALVALLCFANSVAGGFVFDDKGYLLGRPLIRSLTNISRLITESYRPLRNVSYAIDFAIWGEKPFGFHLTNVLMHAANVVLAFTLVRRLSIGLVGATIAALIFAVHPMQPDSVAYISGRRDLLFTLFYLASLHFYFSYQHHTSRRGEEKRSRTRSLALYGLFLGSWLLSLMSKEMAASLPAVVFLWNFCESWNTTEVPWIRRLVGAVRAALRKDRWLYMALALIAPAYAFYTIVVTSASLRARLDGLNYWGGSFYTNLLTTLTVHAWYLKQLILPTPVIQYSGAFDPAVSVFDWRVIVALIVVPGALISGFFLLDRDRRLAFAVFSYFALLLPVSHIIPHHELLADHYLYLPLMSFGMLMGIGVEKSISRWTNARKFVLAGVSAVLVLLAVMTFFRNRAYHDDLVLWETNYQEAPNSFRAAYNLANENLTRFPARAAQLYERSIELDPTSSPPYVALVRLYQTRESARRLEEIIKRGLDLPDSALGEGPFHYRPARFRSDLTGALGSAKAIQGDSAAAQDLFVQAIHMSPDNPQPYEPLSNYYSKTDREQDLLLLRQYAVVSPIRGKQALILRFIEYQRLDEAVPYLNEIIADVPNDFFANYQLGQMARVRSDCGLARSYLTVAEGSAENPADVRTVQEARTGLERQCK